MPTKSLVCIHGRSFKPPRAKLRRLWFDALAWGIQRDHPGKLPALRAVQKEFAYYGDISNRFLSDDGRSPDGASADDTPSRRTTLNDLKQYTSTDFTKRNYNALPGKQSSGETLADLFGGVAAFFRVSDPLIGLVAPDIREYWNAETSFGSDVRERLTIPLARALGARHRVAIVAHSLGTMISWDVLWKLSHYCEYRGIRNRKIDLLVTMGSPLGDETVKRHLKGASAKGDRRFPTNIRRWINIAADDDYVAHDETVRGDYAAMRRADVVNEIVDHRVYNLAVRHGSSNPHSSAGYLVHPVLTEILAGWL